MAAMQSRHAIASCAAALALPFALACGGGSSASHGGADSGVKESDAPGATDSTSGRPGADATTDATADVTASPDGSVGLPDGSADATMVTPPDAPPSGDSSVPASGDGGTVWQPLRIGAGGFVIGIDIAADGTKVVRTDTYGAYLSTASSASGWRQLVTANTLPAAFAAPGNNAGVYEIRIAPSNTQRLYMAYLGYVFRSDDQGASFTQTSFAVDSSVANAAGDNYRTDGEKMAVDPANPDVVYFGTPTNGLWMTVDGGGSWQKVSGITTGTTAGYPGIAFDPTSGTTGGNTSTLYVPSWGNGVWISKNAGSTWTKTNGGPTTVNNAAVAADGTYYAVDGTAAWKYAGGAWTSINSQQGWHAVACDPANAARVILIDGGGNMNESLDRGSTWLGTYSPGLPNPMITRVATDVPWLAWTNEYYMTSGNLAFDATSGELYFSEGIGVWKTSFPETYTPFAWTSQSAGIEQLVANVVTAPPGGKPVVANWDRALFYAGNLNAYPSTHGVSNANSIVAGWDVDYAEGTPSFLAAVVDWNEFNAIDQSATSTNGGQTWTPFPTYPPWSGAPQGGCLAVSTPANFVWLPSGQAPYVTQDGAQTWKPVTLPGESNLAGVFGPSYLHRHVVAADRVNAGTFYLYDSGKGVYASTDEGSSWTLAHSGQLVGYDNYNATLKAVPGKAGHLFFTAGQLSGAGPSGSGTADPFLHSTDGGATWNPIATVSEVFSFGFGASAPGASYPTIFIAGYVGSEYGIWRSTDEAMTWTSIGQWPNASLDEVTTVDGDKSVYGEVYVGFGGSGYAYGVLD
jgi:hypothetical protein